MSVDYRTRTDAGITDIGFTDFFTSLLPGLLEKNSHCIEPWLERNDLDDLSIECEGTSRHLTATAGHIEVKRGASTRGLLVKLDASEFSGLVNDLYTPMTFFVSGCLDILRGEMSSFLDWWLVIRALVDARRIYIPGDIEFVGRDGTPLDLNRSFTLEDSIEDMRHFLETAGLRAQTWSFRQRLTQIAYRDWLNIPVLTNRLLPGLHPLERVRRIEAAYCLASQDSWRWESWRGWTAWRSAG